MSNDKPVEVEFCVRKARDYLQCALDHAPALTVDQWVHGAQVYATLALALATDKAAVKRG